MSTEDVKGQRRGFYKGLRARHHREVGVGREPEEGRVIR